MSTRARRAPSTASRPTTSGSRPTSTSDRPRLTDGLLYRLVTRYRPGRVGGVTRAGLTNSGDVGRHGHRGGRFHLRRRRCAEREAQGRRRRDHRHEIRVAVIADVDTPHPPGLFQKSVDAMEAWAKVVNRRAASRAARSSIDFIDSKLNAERDPQHHHQGVRRRLRDGRQRGAVPQQRRRHGRVQERRGGGDRHPRHAGERARQRAGVLAGHLRRQRPGSYCETKDDNPQTYTTLQGDYLYYLKKNKDLHGIWTIPADLTATKNAVIPTATAGVDLGIKKDGEGFYDIFSRDPQSAMTPIVQAIKQNNSKFAYNGGNKMADLRKEATLQGVNSVKVWACNQACYNKLIVKQGGADVDDTQIVMTSFPSTRSTSRTRR